MSTPNEQIQKELLELKPTYSEREVREVSRDVLNVYGVDNVTEIVDLIIREMNDRKVQSSKELDNFIKHFED